MKISVEELQDRLFHISARLVEVSDFAENVDMETGIDFDESISILGYQLNNIWHASQDLEKLRKELRE